MTPGPAPRPSHSDDLARRYLGLLAVLQEGVLVQDAEGRVVEANAAADFLFAAPSGTLVGRDDPTRGAVDEDYRPIDDSDTPAALALAGGSLVSGRIIGIHAVGGTSVRWYSVNAQPLTMEEGAAPDLVVTSFTDVTERKALEVELTHLALHDGLTGLANRTLLLDRIGHAIARAARRQSDPTVGVSALFIDIDAFKSVNDNLGSRAGDEILRILAQRLRSAVREEDTVARVGGDEFVVLCDEMNRTDLARFCVRVTQVFSQPVICRVGQDWKPVAIGCTAGVAMARPGEDADHFLQRIDKMRKDQSAASAAERGAGRAPRSIAAPPAGPALPGGGSTGGPRPQPGAHHRHRR